MRDTDARARACGILADIADALADAGLDAAVRVERDLARVRDSLYAGRRRVASSWRAGGVDVTAEVRAAWQALGELAGVEGDGVRVAAAQDALRSLAFLSDTDKGRRDLQEVGERISLVVSKGLPMDDVLLGVLKKSFRAAVRGWEVKERTPEARQLLAARKPPRPASPAAPVPRPAAGTLPIPGSHMARPMPQALAKTLPGSGPGPSSPTPDVPAPPPQGPRRGLAVVAGGSSWVVPLESVVRALVVTAGSAPPAFPEVVLGGAASVAGRTPQAPLMIELRTPAGNRVVRVDQVVGPMEFTLTPVREGEALPEAAQGTCILPDHQRAFVLDPGRRAA